MKERPSGGSFLGVALRDSSSAGLIYDGPFGEIVQRFLIVRLSRSMVSCPQCPRPRIASTVIGLGGFSSTTLPKLAFPGEGKVVTKTNLQYSTEC